MSSDSQAVYAFSSSRKEASFWKGAPFVFFSLLCWGRNIWGWNWSFCSLSPASPYTTGRVSEEFIANLLFDSCFRHVLQFILSFLSLYWKLGKTIINYFHNRVIKMCPGGQSRSQVHKTVPLFRGIRFFASALRSYRKWPSLTHLLTSGLSVLVTSPSSAPAAKTCTSSDVLLCAVMCPAEERASNRESKKHHGLVHIKSEWVSFRFPSLVSISGSLDFQQVKRIKKSNWENPYKPDKSCLWRACLDHQQVSNASLCCRRWKNTQAVQAVLHQHILLLPFTTLLKTVTYSTFLWQTCEATKTRATSILMFRDYRTDEAFQEQLASEQHIWEEIVV